MLNLVAALAAALGGSQSAPATPAPAVAVAVAARPLSAVPNVKIDYYDIAGTTPKAIQSSVKAAGTKLDDWSMGVGLTKMQTGDVCTVTAAKVTLTASAHLPRLTQEAKVPADILAQWKVYVNGLEQKAANDLWLVADRIPTIEQSLTGKPCDQAQPTLNAALDQLRSQSAMRAAAPAAVNANVAPQPARTPGSSY